jgi:hypothetical protein
VSELAILAKAFAFPAEAKIRGLRRSIGDTGDPSSPLSGAGARTIEGVGVVAVTQRASIARPSSGRASSRGGTRVTPGWRRPGPGKLPPVHDIEARFRSPAPALTRIAHRAARSVCNMRMANRCGHQLLMTRCSAPRPAGAGTPPATLSTCFSSGHDDGRALQSKHALRAITDGPSSEIPVRNPR